MTLSGFALVWLMVAAGCMLAGLILTYRRVLDASPRSSVFPRGENEERRSASAAQCSRCAQALDAGARFCGACGQSVERGWNAKRSVRARG